MQDLTEGLTGGSNTGSTPKSDSSPGQLEDSAGNMIGKGEDGVGGAQNTVLNNMANKSSTPGESAAVEAAAMEQVKDRQEIGATDAKTMATAVQQDGVNEEQKANADAQAEVTEANADAEAEITESAADGASKAVSSV